jgi:hypothetical protein
MEAAGMFETSVVSASKSTRCYNPDDQHRSGHLVQKQTVRTLHPSQDVTP